MHVVSDSKCCDAMVCRRTTSRIVRSAAWRGSLTTSNQSSVASAATQTARAKTATKDTRIATNLIAQISATNVAPANLVNNDPDQLNISRALR